MFTGDVSEVVKDLLSAVLALREVEKVRVVADEGGGGRALLEVRVAQHVGDEGHVGLDAADARLVERAHQLVAGALEGERVGYHLHEHRVVVGRDGGAGVGVAAVEPDAEALGRTPEREAARVGAEVLLWVLGSNARLERKG